MEKICPLGMITEGLATIAGKGILGYQEAFLKEARKLSLCLKANCQLWWFCSGLKREPDSGKSGVYEEMWKDLGIWLTKREGAAYVYIEEQMAFLEKDHGIGR